MSDMPVQPDQKWPREEVQTTDAGAACRDRLAERKAKLEKAWHRTVCFLLLLVVLVVASTVAVAYRFYSQRVGGYNVDWKHCGFKDDKFELEGSRRFGYPYVVIAGVRFNVMEEVDEKTYLKTKGEKVRVVSMTEGSKPEYLTIKTGDSGDKHPLPKADTYVFIYDNDVAVVHYNEFCK